MKRAIAGLVLVPFLITSCVTGTNVTFESNPPGAQVYLDNRPIGRTPVSHRIGNGFWVDPQIRVELDGYLPVTDRLEKEIKAVNLVFGLLLWVPAYLWVWGPKSNQYYTLRESTAATSRPQTRQRDSQEVVTQVNASLRRVLDAGTNVRLGVAATQSIDDDGNGADPAEYVDSVAADLLDRFGRDPLFSFVDRESTPEILSELEFQLSGMVDPSQLAEYGRLSGASHLLILDYSRQTQGNLVTITDRRRLVQVETGTALATDTVQIVLLWDSTSAQYRTVSSTHNGRPVSVVDGRMFPAAAE